MYQWMFWEQYSHEPAIAVLRFQKHYLKKSDQRDRSQSAQALRQRSHADEQSSGSSAAIFVGEKLSLADIALVAYTRFAPQAGLDLALYPHIPPWIEQVERDLKLARNG